jgi:hypothetical protein
VGRAFWGLLAVLAAFGVYAPAANASLSVPFISPTSLPAFEAAAGGGDNGTTAGEQPGGFRNVTWTGVALDGTDPGSTVVSPGKVVALSRSRAQPWGLELGPNVAVANDSFASVNQHASGLFAAPRAWAPFNSNVTEFEVVAPGAQTSTPVPALTRGLGVVFLNVQTAGTTIQYYNGQTLLGQVSAPTGTTSFAGLLFSEPVVSRVVITLGTATIFDFDGTTATAGGTDPTTLVAGGDVVLGEPGAGQPTVAATAGQAVSSVLSNFTDTDPNATPADFRAAIDWGDGTRSAGTVAPKSGGGFVVTGSHAYAKAGTYTPKVTVDDFSGSDLATQALVTVAVRPTAMGVVCSPSPVAVSAGTNCVATVADLAGPGAGAPTGVVTFSTATPGAGFGQDGGCVLAATAIPGSSSCVVRFTPGQLPPNQARVSAAYAGDDAHAGAGAAATVGVRAQRCTLRALSRRLGAGGLGVLVTCDARSGVQIAVRALASRHGKSRAFQLRYGTLHSAVVAGRPTVLVVKPDSGVLKVLRSALHHHQRVSLRLTLTASSNATQRTTTTRASAVRVLLTRLGALRLT